MQVFWFVHLQLLLLIAFIVSVAAEGLLFTYDRRGLWMHFTAEDNKTAVKTTLQLPVRLLRYFNVILSLTDEPDMCEPQQTGQNVRSLRCDDQALLMKWERAHRAKSLTAMLR